MNLLHETTTNLIYVDNDIHIGPDPVRVNANCENLSLARNSRDWDTHKKLETSDVMESFGLSIQKRTGVDRSIDET